MPLAAAGVAVLLLLARIPYVVEATEYAVRTRFGRPVAVVTKPGLHARSRSSTTSPASTPVSSTSTRRRASS